MEIFKEGSEYANRNGNYTVLEISESKMTVRYEDGSTAELSIPIQQRIWENILAEREAVRARSSRTRKQKANLGTHFYIKPTSMMTVEELSASSRQDGVPATGKWLATIRRGDRLIYYAQESQVFFAVVTITGPGKPARGRKRSEQEDDAMLFFPVDVDAYIIDLDRAVIADSIELESQPDFMRILANSDDFLEITEDEFELLAEILTEVSEEDEDEEEEDEKEDEFD